MFSMFSKNEYLPITASAKPDINSLSLNDRENNVAAAKALKTIIDQYVFEQSRYIDRLQKHGELIEIRCIWHRLQELNRDLKNCDLNSLQHKSLMQIFYSQILQFVTRYVQEYLYPADEQVLLQNIDCNSLQMFNTNNAVIIARALNALQARIKKCLMSRDLDATQNAFPILAETILRVVELNVNFDNVSDADISKTYAELNQQLRDLLKGLTADNMRVEHLCFLPRAEHFPEDSQIPEIAEFLELRNQLDLLREENTFADDEFLAQQRSEKCETTPSATPPKTSVVTWLYNSALATLAPDRSVANKSLYTRLLDPTTEFSASPSQRPHP